MHIQGYFLLPFISTKNVNRMESTELLETSEALHNNFRQKPIIFL